MQPVNPEFFPLTDLAGRFVDELAQCRKLNIEALEASEHHVLLKLPYHESLVGYPETQVLHGGVITTLMDTASGAAVICSIFAKEKQLELCPTLDLRVDYMKAAKPGEPVFAMVECFKLTSSVAFTRGMAYQDSIDDPIAQVVCSFMRIGPELVTESFRTALMGEGQG
ncbi:MULTISPECIES: PaaI family thioesterase [Ferrimonas]|uniref:PaaI family thioesterase n=1 Tax=Ferrimonas TaxID=44011 RepID=UPI00040DCAA0|nr:MULTISPECIES: PaaI family thioesterase [Ferrimonas]USD35853.1 PaaI family thioesterase [Ferrimonas sp. SCSIO 43195]